MLRCALGIIVNISYSNHILIYVCIHQLFQQDFFVEKYNRLDVYIAYDQQIKPT